MRARSGGVILFPPDPQGMMGAAALLRMLGPDHDLLALGPHETARRLYGLSTEPVPRRVFVVDLLPADSVDTLLVPALHRFLACGVPAAWFWGQEDVPAVLDSLGDLVTLHSGRGKETWRVVTDLSGDESFVHLGEALEAREEGPGTTWRMVLAAVASSWDWRRVYAAVTALARLDAPTGDQRAWAVEQLTEADRALSVLEKAPVRELGGLTFAVVGDPQVAAKVRPEALRGGRDDVDAYAFVAGPNRLRLVAARPGADLSVLQDVPGLVEYLQEGAVISGSITMPRAEAWASDDVPAPVCALLDAEVLGSAARVDGARIHRPHSDRRAKGIDLTRLPPQDRRIIREALGSDPPGSDRDAAGDPQAMRSPAHRTGIEIEVVATHVVPVPPPMERL